MRDLIYSVDKWTSYLWKRVLKESPIITEHVTAGRKRVPTFDSFAREVFARMYASPLQNEKTRPEDEWAKTMHAVLDELPAFKKLAAHCARNKDFAAAATANILEQLVERLPTPPTGLADPDARRREVRGLLDFLKGLDPQDPVRTDIERSIAEATRAGKDALAAMTDVANHLDPDAVRQALRRSVDDAATEVEELNAAAAGLSGIGGNELVSDETRLTLGAALRENENLKRLGVLAGRMRSLAMGKRRSRTKTAASELSDVTVGGEIARVLPHELLKLSDPLLSLDFFRAFMERSLLQYTLVGNEREGRGPVVVLIDDSDSMDGAPSTFAKAAALALADAALADRRECRLVRFSHRINATIDLRPRHSGDTQKDLLRFLSGAVDGGTNFELPLRTAAEAIDAEPVYERADVILITDGEAELSDAFLTDWRRRATRDGLSTYAVHIGATPPQVLRALTPDVISLKSLVPERLEDALFGRITT